MNLTEMTNDNMLTVFNTYFRIKQITDVRFENIGRGRDKEYKWKIPPDTFQVHPLANNVRFNGYFKATNATQQDWKGNVINPEVKIMSDDVVLSRMFPENVTSMLKSLENFLPVKPRIPRPQDISETNTGRGDQSNIVTILEKILSSMERLSNITSYLISIQNTLERVEAALSER
jgi:hypothetical protein